MATIEKRLAKNSATSWRAKIRLKGHQSLSASFARLTDAKKWVTQTESSIQEGRYFKYAESKRRTLGDAIDRYSNEILGQLKDPYSRIQHLSWWVGMTKLAYQAIVR